MRELVKRMSNKARKTFKITVEYWLGPGETLVHVSLWHQSFSVHVFCQNAYAFRERWRNPSHTQSTYLGGPPWLSVSNNGVSTCVDISAIVLSNISYKRRKHVHTGSQNPQEISNHSIHWLLLLVSGIYKKHKNNEKYININCH